MVASRLEVSSALETLWRVSKFKAVHWKFSSRCCCREPTKYQSRLATVDISNHGYFFRLVVLISLISSLLGVLRLEFSCRTLLCVCVCVCCLLYVLFLFDQRTKLDKHNTPYLVVLGVWGGWLKNAKWVVGYEKSHIIMKAGFWDDCHRDVEWLMNDSWNDWYVLQAGLCTPVKRFSKLFNKKIIM